MMTYLKSIVLFALVVKVDCIIDWTADIRATSAATSAITSGASVLQGLIGATDYRVVCSIEIENWTKYPLEYPESHINGGIIQTKLVTVGPGQREMFVAHKTGYTATGTYGTASWLISSNDKRAVVMWSCPYNFNHYSNWLAIGLTTKGTHNHNDWYHQMYYDSSGHGLNFVRGEYYSHTNTISIKDGDFEITGNMGTSHKAKIVVRPLQPDDLAPNVKLRIEEVEPSVVG